MSWLSRIRDRLGFSGRNLSGGGGTKFTSGGGTIRAAEREVQAMGPWSGALGQFQARTVNPHLYEALREALPPLDGGIEALVALDGIVRVGGSNKRLVADVRAFIESVAVNDAQFGLQAVYSGMGNEQYEQGFAVSEWTPSKDGRDIAGIRIADSKGVHFLRDTAGMRVFYRPPGAPAGGRRDGTDQVERILRGTAAASRVDSQWLLGHGFAELDTRRLIYSVHAPEADNPYGTSKLRSVEFVSQIILAIQNATDQTWRRFGDPVFDVLYKTKNRSASDPTKLEERKRTIAANLAAALEAKRKGNSADFVNAIGADDDLTVRVLGASEQVLQIEMPARHLLEQVLAKFRIASWVLGYTWNASDRSADGQAEMMLMDGKNRWEARRPYLQRLVETWLRLRGKTWSAGDWFLEQEVPSLRDMLKTAQADFLRAQTVLMLSGAGTPGSAAEPGSDPRGGGGKLAEVLRSGKIPLEALHEAVTKSADAASLAVALNALAEQFADA
jgi:hypothetical protein